ncbi:MAG: hypothetical protein JWS10_2970 [Cypionkella sp.]|nr:hypothetical protein [Cypionkella sp.]
MTHRMFEGFAVPQDGPLTEAEKGWIELLRVICFDGVPPPSLEPVQALRDALDHQRRLRERPGR